MWSAGQQWLAWLATRPIAVVFWCLSHLCSWFQRKQSVPPVPCRLLLHSAAELARMIRSREVTCVKVIETYIARVKEVNPVLNAVVQDRFDQALEEARAVDKTLGNTSKSQEELASETPLLGVPVTFKESIAVKGMSNNAGDPEYKRVASEDAVAVATLKARGAIPLLVSNTPEYCLSFETHNPITGRTNNPYDTRRTPGGSSGGEAALLSSAASVLGLGSDIGGSGRVPAGFCGVFGHKPSSGFIDATRHMPSSDDPLWKSAFVFAPMARYASDLPLLMASCVPDAAKLKQLRLDEPVDLKSVKFYFMEHEGSRMTLSIHRDVKTALRKTTQYFEQTFKVPVEKLDIDEFKHVPQLCFYLLMRMKACNTIFQVSDEDPTKWRSVTWQFIKFFLGVSPHTFHAVFFGGLKWFTDLCSDRSARSLNDCKDTIVKHLQDKLGNSGVLLCPIFPSPANLHMQGHYRQMSAGYTSLYNLVDMPATACPVMINSSGLPVGIQVVANRGQDRLTLAVAQELERAFGGWVPPSGTVMLEIKS